jgi:hypothetical protein
LLNIYLTDLIISQAGPVCPEISIIRL